MWDYRTDVAGLLRKIVRLVGDAAEWIDRPPSGPEGLSKFLDLAPTDEADKDGVYAKALLAAMDKPQVFNIALTGPYGSGKSSIIKSFLKKYRSDTLQISLAAFLPESGSKSVEVETDSVESKHTRDRATKQEIERSILQQMLYGADANRLPFSRFKRIQIPGKWSSLFVSLYLALALLSCWHLFQKRDAIVKGDYFLPFALSNWFNLTSFVLAVALLWLVVHRFYVASFGVSLKSLSLKDIQIAPAAIDQESILNRHLDEIIYFFQSTKYDLVIIEDLDRFNDPEIFVTLREINKIVNENSGVKRRIRFLYALRDDMFVNTDRTKFFEFIIPVIPIINSSNSIDMVIREGTRLSLDGRLNRQFLREVSRYLSDLRLIRNIFNEYAIYAANLETDDENVWNANKLLAVLIYKNIFPSDFEELHRGKGKLAKILERHDHLVSSGEAACKAEITHLEEQIDTSDRQLPSNLKELSRIYAMALIEKLPASTSNVGLSGQALIPLSALPEHELFDQIVEASRLTYAYANSHQQNLDISGFQAEVDPQTTYKQRQAAIEMKSTEFREATSKRIHEIRTKIATLRTSKFNELIRSNAEGVDELFRAFGDNAELARFLVFEGYLDDNYYQYTSLFHAGRLSPSDNKFLMQIRAFVTPEPGFQIDHPKEVIAQMRDEDFSQSYVLNVKIVDCLLSEPSTYSIQTTKLYAFIASNFEKSDAFLSNYYASGVAVSALIPGLVKAWDGLIPAATRNTTNLSHVAHIIAHLPTMDLAALPERYPTYSEFVSTNLAQILALGIEFEPSRLKLLKIESTDLNSVVAYPRIVRLLFDEGLYKLSISNIDFIFRSLLGLDEEQKRLHKQHYTTVLRVGNDALTAKTEHNFAEYLENVLLSLEDNTEESLSAILSIIRRDELETERLREFLEKQSAVIPALDQVPARLHAALFEIEKFEASWENCLAFLSSDTYDPEILTAYLNKNDTVASLSRLPIPDGEQALALRKFLIENDALEDDAYASYVRVLPKPFAKFPEDLSWEKVQILIEHKKVTFTGANLAFLNEYDDAQIPFVAKNIERYFEIESECAPDDEFREKLLGSNISDDQKLKIIKAMDLNLLASMPSRAANVGPIMQRVGADFSELRPEPSRAIVLNSRPIQVQMSLFNKLQKKFDVQQIGEILAQLPGPFSEIRPGWDIPRIDNTDVNLEFVEWLKARRVISSWSIGFFGGDIRINNFRK